MNQADTVIESCRRIYQQRALLWALTSRDLEQKLGRSILGYWWLLLYPLLLLITYSLVFGEIFGSRWPATETRSEFVVMLFSGLLFYFFFSEVLNRATSAIKSNATYVKKTVFSHEILALVIVGSSGVSALVNLFLLLSLHLVAGGNFSLLMLLAPLVIFPFCMLVTGVALVLSALTVFFEDLVQIVLFLTQLLLFLSPVFFPLSAVPHWLQPLLVLNPLTIPIEQMRVILLGDAMVNWWMLGNYWVIACVVLYLGQRIFKLCQPTFADVL
jgi:lipopolysaccharide transport system permease protein